LDCYNPAEQVLNSSQRAAIAEMISALLLAAGESRRMKSFKPLLQLAGKTFIECCVDNLLASRAGEVLVVTGHRQQDIRRQIGDRPVRIIHNPNYRQGMSTSIKQGLASLSSSAQAVIIALADQPLVTTAIFNQLIEAYEAARPLLVIPTHGGQRGHPIIIDLNLRGEVLAMDPDQGLRQVVHAHESDIAYIEVASDSVLIDFDYPEDYQRLTGQQALQSGPTN
jgi:molybdenum cofactor cytidylyltransferase